MQFDWVVNCTVADEKFELEKGAPGGCVAGGMHLLAQCWKLFVEEGALVFTGNDVYARNIRHQPLRY